MDTLISSSALAGIKELVDSYGVDATTLAKSVGLPEEALTSNTLPISAIKVNRLLHAATKECKDPYLNLKLARTMRWVFTDEAWQHAISDGTLRGALEAKTQDQEEHTMALAVYFKEELNGLAFGVDMRWPLRGDALLKQGEIVATELSLAICCNEIRRLLGDDWQPIYTQFRHKRPQYYQPLLEQFGPALAFNQELNAIYLSEEDLQTPLSNNWCSERESPQLVITPAEKMPLPVKVDRAIREIYSTQSCSITKVADRLSMPARSLQHRLKADGTNYQALFDHVRLEQVNHYLLTSDLTITEIAERLHFSETAALTRFVKMKTGLTPKQIRCG